MSSFLKYLKYGKMIFHDHFNETYTETFLSLNYGLMIRFFQSFKRKSLTETKTRTLPFSLEVSRPRRNKRYLVNIDV